MLHGGKVTISAVAFSLDGTMLASGNRNSTIRLWDGRSGAALYTLEGHKEYISAVAFSPDGTLASGSGDATIKLWG